MDIVLKSWGHADFITIFKANDINDLTALSALLNDPIEAKLVIPSAGIRLDLKKKLKQHSDMNAAILIECEPGARVEEVLNESFQTENQPIELPESDSDLDNVQVKESTPASQKRKKVSSIVEEFDLKSVLLEHPIGSAILKIYEAKHDLCSTCQSLLCEIITLHFLKNETRKLENEDFLVLRDKIVELFPCECPQLYYVPPVLKNDSRRNRSEPSKGKLVDKYRNRKTFIREANSLSKNGRPTLEDQVPKGGQANVESSREWLILNRDPNEVEKHWEITYSIRDQDAQNLAYKLVADIYDKWPILEDSMSFELIEKDFLKKCSTTFEDFELLWTFTSKTSFDLYKNKLSREDGLLLESLATGFSSNDLESLQKQNYNTFVELTILSAILCPKSAKIILNDEANSSTNKSSIQKSKRKPWKPTKLEALEGILLHVKLPGDIEIEVQKKREKMLELGLPLQPFIIVVGVNSSSLTNAYVRVDKVTYQLPSLLRAIDILFKIYLNFNISYPPETQNFCYFIQWALYDLSTSFDSAIPAVCGMVSKVKKNRK